MIDYRSPVRWYEKTPNLLLPLSQELAKKYPDLRLEIVGETGELIGTFPVIHDGIELDRFYVRILIPKEFPAEIPVVFETAGRIPVSAAWHSFSHGSLCVIVPEEWLLNSQSNSLIAYLDGPLRNYFINHALAEAGEARPMGERSHGSAGLFESYGEMVQATDSKTIVRYLDYITAKKLKAHWPCPCRSGRPVGACHLAHMLTLRRTIPRWIAAKALGQLNIALARERVAEARVSAGTKIQSGPH